MTPKNASTRYVEQTISLERDAAGEPIGLLAITRLHGPEGSRARRRARQRSGGSGQSRQERIPRQHEPRDPDADERHHRHDGARDGRSPLRVLVAEDNIVNQRVASGLLTRRGHDVAIVSNGREAVNALEREAFDVVLMDVQMPEMNGFEATAAIRAFERSANRRVRVIAMTAHAMSGDRERCLAAGMDDYVAKPIDPEQFFEVIES